MKIEKLFWSAPAWRANLEGWLLAAVCLGLLSSIARYLEYFPMFQGVVLVGAAVPSLVGLRRKALPGRFGQVIVLEVVQACLITAGLILTEYVLMSVFQVETNLAQLLKIPDPLVYLVSAGVYLFWRGFRWLWLKWKALRESRFAWSLTHSFLTLITGLVLIGLVLVMLVVPFSTLQPVKEGAPLSVEIVARVISFLFYVLLASPVALVPMLALSLPLMAGASYWVSRRATRRLDHLTRAAARLSQGDWSARVPPDGGDEIARLGASFNHMAGELERTTQSLIEQRDRIAGLLTAQRELTASVSHELRTPVATARAYLENDLDRLESLPPDQLRQDLEIACHEITRLQDLIDDLLALSKAEVNRLGLDMQAVDVAPLVSQAVAASAGLAWDARRVRVETQLPAQLPAVWADGSRLEQVLRNLLANGVRHTPPGGFVVVTADVLENRLRLAVTDTGEGLGPDEKEHLWERFHRGPGQPGDGRSGLGLAIVKELTESMGGTVAAESEPDQGSTFIVYLNLEQT